MCYKKELFKLLLLFMAFFSIVNLYSQVEPEEINIGIILDYESARIYYAPMIINETNTLAGSRYNIRFPDDKVVSGDYDFDKLKQYAMQFLADDEVDIIIGVGGLVSEILAQSGPYAKPVLAYSIFHPGLQNVPITSSNTSGVKNFGYSLFPLSMERDLEAFYSIYQFKHLGFIIYEEYVNHIPSLNDFFLGFMEKYDAEAEIIPAGEDFRTTIESIPAEVDAVYVGFLYDYNTEAFQEFINLLNEKKIPTFTMIGRPFVELGILAGAAPGNNLENLSRRTALDVEKILEGQDPANFSVAINYKDELVVNMKTARVIDFFPSFTTLSQAEILFEEDLDNARTITFPGMIAELLENNLNLRIANQQVRAGLNEINKARSNLLPQVDVSATNIRIDETRAEGSFGMNPEKATLGTGQFSQLLFSEPAIANLQIQKILQEKRNYEFNQQELDLILQAGEAYINILKVQNYLEILRENLNLTRKHLDIARLRQEVGFSGASDVYRWESEIERVSIDVINARAQKRAADMALNEILNRSLDETFIATDLESNDQFITGEGFDYWILNARTWKYFTQFMVNEGLNRSPELKQLDKYIEVQERLIRSNKRSRYMPSVGLKTQGDYYLSRRGAGSTLEPVEIPGLGSMIIGTEPEDFQWNLAISASIPIFQGGYKEAEIQQSEIDLSIFQDRRNDLANKITQRSITSFEFVGASSPAMEMASRAAEAANRSLELSQDAYRRGLISIVDLIDVQKAAAQSNLLETNSVYDYLLDFLQLSRATSINLFLLTVDEKTDLMIRLSQYMVINAPDELIK